MDLSQSEMEVDQAEENATEDDSFGQTVPPLHVYVKRVLNKYPEGGQILKELLQNADDAEARRVIFLYDKTEHPTEHLWSESLNNLYGPTLYVYNDATFRDADWTNIQNPEQSGKQDDPIKVGRFGLGFISVYHLTDVPSIFSSNYVGFLDPNERYFATDPVTKVTEKGKRGKRWRVSKELLRPPLRDQFMPYVNSLFGCTENTFKNGHFDGTIFRFPLRTEGTDSLISRSTYNEERVQSIFRSFRNDAEISLLFLKNVESVSIYERDNEDNAPRLIYQVEMSSETKTSLRNERSTFLSKCQQNTTAISRIEAKISIHTAGQESPIYPKVCTNDYIVINNVKRHGLSQSMQKLVEDRDLKQLPWVGIAAKKIHEVGTVGRMFCFLPLPESESSQLPVHIHGYFGLGDNRRSIKWPDGESEHDNAAQWNVGLVEEVFPETYVDLIQTAITCGLPPSTVYGMWPKVANLRGAWKNGVKLALEMLNEQDVLYTEANEGQWKKLRDVYIDTGNSALIHKVLLKRGYPIVQLPPYVLEALRWSELQFEEVTPDLMRKAVKGDPLDWLDRREKMDLLAYVLKDKHLHNMESVHLLPLSDGSFIPFCKPGTTVYIPNSEVPKHLFPNMEKSLVADDCPKILKSPEAQSATQLQMLSVGIVTSLLKECLPKEWTNRSKTVSWTPGTNGHPEKNWLKNLWKWLQKEDISLHSFGSLPLIQIDEVDDTITLARLEANRMIYQKHISFTTSTELTDSVCIFLESIGAIVVRNGLPGFIQKHRQISNFIACGNGEGVMQILETQWSSDIPQYISQSQVCLKKNLLHLLSQVLRLPDQWRIIVRKLPLFHANTGEFVSVEQCTEGVQTGFLGIPIRRVSHRFILIDHSSSLAKALGVEEVTLEDLLAKYILPDVDNRYYTQEECDTLMEWVLDRAHLDKLVERTKFIPTSNGGWASPGQLFDPRSTLLRSLYHNKPVFPTKQYASGRLLGHIRRIGFKEESSISAEDLLKIATDISKIADSTRSKALLDFVCKHPTILSNRIMIKNNVGTLGNLLSNIGWVTCMQSPPSWYHSTLPWCQQSRFLQCPKQVQLEIHANLLGSVLPLVKVSQMHESFVTYFEWTSDARSLKVEHVVSHLKNVATTAVQDRNMHSISSTVLDTYEFLNNTALSELKSMFVEGGAMGDVPWVWHGKGFTTPSKVAFSSGISNKHLPSYLHLIPQKLCKFKTRLIELGVKATFTIEDYMNILKLLKNTEKDRPLSSEDIDAVQAILKAVTSSTVHLRGFEDQLFVLDCNYVLRPIHEVIYNDLTWNRTSEDYIYAHNSLTRHQAKKLGVRSQRDVQLDQCSSDLGFELPFGQTEKLTTRLRGIIREYSHTPDVLKELLQNADDAGASELHVVYDPRKHKGTKISGPEWEPMHNSPAICVYNDKSFTDEDIIGIQNVGVGGKISDATTTGRFGIGFNAVYHLTDCPTFLTRNTTKLCVFDPHVKYVPRATYNKPGKLYDEESRGGYKKNFPDMIDGYLQEYRDFDLKNGTMFRFPLRQSGMSSEISDEYYEPDRVHTLLEDFEKVSTNALLFLNNVQKITISQIDPQTGRLCLRYRVGATLSDEDQKRRLELTSQLTKYKGGQANAVSQVNSVYSMNVTDSRGRKEEWLVCQTLGYSNLKDSNLFQKREFMDKAFIPRGGVAALMNRDITSGKAFCFLPLQINTSLPVHINGTFILDQSRRNLKKGNSELIHDWNKLLAEQVIAPAYACLIEAAGKKLFQSKSKVTHKDGMWICKAYDNIFPSNLNQLDDVWKLIATSTLKYIGDNSLKVLPVVRNEVQPFKYGDIQWCCPSYYEDNAFFDNLYKFDEDNDTAPLNSTHSFAPVPIREKKSTTLRLFLHRTGFNLIACKPAICRAFVQVGINATFVSPQFCIQHIRNTSTVTKHLPCLVNETKFRSLTCLKIILEFCLNGIDKVDGLLGLPLQLDGSNNVTVFSTTSPKYLTYNYRLIPCCQELFIHGEMLVILFQWLSKWGGTEKAFRSGILKDFTTTDLAQFIHTQLPPYWKGARSLVDWRPTSSDHPNIAWLQMLWGFIGSGDLNPLTDWPIFPTKCGRLCAPNIAKQVLFLDNYGDTSDRERFQVSSALVKLGCPVVDVQKMMRPSPFASLLHHPRLPPTGILTRYLATPISHKEVLNAIISLVSIENKDISRRLTDIECDTILKYFQSGITNLSDPDLIQLKGLPLFSPANSQCRISINQFQHCYTYEDRVAIPDIEFDTWMQEAGCVFLRHDTQIDRLYTRLNIRRVRTIDVYKNHVLPRLHQLPYSRQLAHVIFIRDELLPRALLDDDIQGLYDALKEIEFIPNVVRQYHRASHYYDVGNSVFAKMVAHNRFLPMEFRKPEWRLLLINIGLQHVVTGPQLIDFAQEIDSQSKTIYCEKQYLELKEKSEALVTEIQHNALVLDAEIRTRVALISFVPSLIMDKVRLEIHPQYTPTEGVYANRFICFQGGVPEKYKHLTWSVAPLLPTFAIPKQKSILLGLGIELKPSVRKVVQHVHNVCIRMSQYNAYDKEDSVGHLRSELAVVLDKTMGFLKENINGNEEDIKRWLQNTPICPVEDGTILVKANQLVLEMTKATEDHFRPYLYKAPRDLGQYDTVLKVLGTEEELTFDQVAMVLTGIKNKCKDMKMDINERKKAHSATGYLCELLQSANGTCSITVTSLYLPTSKDKLQLSSQLYYTDLDETDSKEIPSSTDIEFVVPLKHVLDKVTSMKEAEIFKLLPENLRPKKIATKEKPLGSNIRCSDVAGSRCPLLVQMQSIINSVETNEVLLRLLQHQIEGVPDAQLQNSIAKLRDFDTLQCVRELKTGYFDKNGTLLGERKVSRNVFLDEDDSGGFELSLAHDDISENTEHRSVFFLPIAQSINRICKLNLDALHIQYLSQVLPLPSVSLKNTFLADCNIPAYDDHRDDIPTPSERPGSIVPRDIWCLLDADMSNKFHPGDMAVYRPHGLEDKDESYIYVEILERLSLDNISDDSASVLRKYKIDIGESSPIVVSVVNIYKFRRPKEEPELQTPGPRPTDVVPYTGRRRTRPSRGVALNIEKVKAQITKDVEDAMKLPENERSNCFRRLYKMWHPDKNPNQVELATKAFQFLQQEIKRVGNQSTSTFTAQYSQWNADINRDHAEEQTYRERAHQRQSHTTSGQQSGSGYVPKSFTNRRPNPRKAKLWHRQAEEDLTTAQEYSTKRVEGSRAWLALMIQQAVEKALKAVIFHVDGSQSMSHNLFQLISIACQHTPFVNYEQRLRGFVDQLVNLRCDAIRPRYPEDGTNRTTGEAYQSFDSEQALTLCRSVFDVVQVMLDTDVAF